MTENIKDSAFNVAASTATSVDEKASLKEAKEVSSSENTSTASTIPERIDVKDLNIDTDGEHRSMTQSDDTVA
jgi:hypothetical protein